MDPITSTYKILILFTHPRLEKSRANKSLLGFIPEQDQVTVHDLYEHYPDFNIKVEHEKELLLKHDIIIWHHPFYWYSAPPLLKQWIDMVLEYGWAYGHGGDKLKDKLIFNAITSGGARQVYQSAGYNRFTIREFLVPFEQTARLCKMIYLPPFAVQGTHRLSETELTQYGQQYQLLLNRMLAGNFLIEDLKKYEYLNDWIAQSIDA
ncbi:MAG: NAD(P)H-dependent oxidoreductase [Candidatus Cyclobacteriaceae bacterium M3_2C_046]